jgi:hypothetical protein
MLSAAIRRGDRLLQLSITDPEDTDAPSAFTSLLRGVAWEVAMEACMLGHPNFF